jgi:hypothetical protein
MACLDSVIIIKTHLLHHSLPPSRERGVYGFQIGVGEEIERRGEERSGPFVLIGGHLRAGSRPI